MNRHETNKANMGSAVAALFDEEKQIVIDYNVFQEPVVKLKRILSEIAMVDNKFSTATGGKTITKNNAEEELLADLMPVKSALFRIGCTLKDEALKALTVESEGSFKRMRDADFLKKATAIQNEALDYLTELAPYKITEPVLAELKIKIGAYELALGGQDTGMAERSALRKELNSKFEELDKVLTEEFDNLIELLKKDNKLFYDKYNSARGIRDLGGGRKSVDEKEEAAVSSGGVK